jgi:hypothetical protein
LNYAKNTTVSIERSRQELEVILRRVGADKVMIGWDGDTTFVAFAINGIPVKQTIIMPPKEEFAQTEQGRDRNEQSKLKAWEQACRQRMREHVVLLKAKLIAITLGFRTIKQEFMADICLPSGNTMEQEYGSQIDKAIATGKIPALLPGI